MGHKLCNTLVSYLCLVHGKGSLKVLALVRTCLGLFYFLHVPLLAIVLCVIIPLVPPLLFPCIPHA